MHFYCLEDFRLLFANGINSLLLVLVSSDDTASLDECAAINVLQNADQN